MTISNEEIMRVKGLGFLNNRGTEKFSARVLTENTCLTAEQLETIAEASRLYADGKVSLTSRMTVEILAIPYENIEPFTAFLKDHDMQVGGTGDKVRPVTSCKGTVCKFGKIDTHSIAKEAHDTFYMGYRQVKLPHKFKIGVGGCPHNCIKPMLNDIGLVGSHKPIFHRSQCHGCKKCGCELICPVGAYTTGTDGKKRLNRNKCIQCGRCGAKCPFKALDGYEEGIRIFVGGTWGKFINIGKPIKGLYTRQEAMAMIEKTILLFKENGKTKERLGKMIERLGFKWFQQELLTGDVLARKDKIINM